MKNKGFTFVEIIVALGLAAIMLPALGRALSFSIRVASQGEKFSQAYNLAQQDMESMYAQKSQNWSGFTGSTIVTSPYTRVITVSSVQRCGVKPTWTICTSGGVSDPDTKKITVVVSWAEVGGPQQITLTSYVTNH